MHISICMRALFIREEAVSVPGCVSAGSIILHAVGSVLFAGRLGCVSGLFL